MTKNPTQRGSRALVAASVLTFCFGALNALLHAAESFEPAERFREQRQVFLEGRESISLGKPDAAAQRIAELDGYPLQAYYEYLILRRRIQQADAPAVLLASVKSFSQRYDDARSYRRLLGVLKNRLAENNDWSAYQQVASIPAAPVHPCDDLYAKVKSGALTGFDRDAGNLWHAIGKHTDRCGKAFDLLIDRAGDVPTGALWKRTVALLQRGALDDVAQLLPFYSSRDRRIVQSWVDHLDDPETLLALESVNGDMMHHQQLVNHVLGRWLREDLPAAAAFWKTNGGAFGFEQKELDQVSARHAVLAAKRAIPEAPALLSDAGSADRQVRYWRIRTALKSAQWAEVLRHLGDLPGQEQSSARWRYWRARALEATGRIDEAHAIYQDMSDQFEYYGFLAADRVRVDYLVPADNTAVDRSSLMELANDNNIAKAIEFFLVNIGWEGRLFWNAALKNIDDAGRAAAAELAVSIGWYDRSYASMKSAGAASARYRYLLPYPSLVAALAADRGVDESLVYAVMKRESGYIPDVKSPAGAIGLMQLMPATAKEMAKKASLGGSPWSLINGEVNIRLGVEYLAAMLSRYQGNVAFAAAAYNAGPSRVTRWREGGELPGDIWVETIPFDETRDYVKAVLFHTAVFDSVRGSEPKRLLSMMRAGRNP